MPRDRFSDQPAGNGAGRPPFPIEEFQMSVADTTGVQAPAHGVTLSETAAAKAKALLERDGSADMVLRIAVQPGGCSGLRYELFFDDRTLDGDALVTFNGIGLAVDRMSKPYLDGAVIDFVDTIEKQGFTIDNPNAQNSCACGDSFH
jgi:iron-sulfur cluster assembly accessory protein